MQADAVIEEEQLLSSSPLSPPPAAPPHEPGVAQPRPPQMSRGHVPEHPWMPQPPPQPWMLHPPSQAKRPQPPEQPNVPQSLVPQPDPLHVGPAGPGLTVTFGGEFDTGTEEVGSG